MSVVFAVRCFRWLSSSPFGFFAYRLFAIALFRRAAVFLWMRPFLAARSMSLTAANLVWALAPAVVAFFTAVRSAERCARLRTVAARDLRMFFFADAIFGTKSVSKRA